MSSRRSPARWLGPLALMAALVAVFAIYSATFGEESGSESSSPATESRTTETGSKKRSGDEAKTSTTEAKTSTTPAKKTYTVRPGDTLAGIAESTGVSVEELQELNPGVDSNSLSIGQELRLAR